MRTGPTTSLRFLVYLARRIEALPLLLVVAARPDEPGLDEDLFAALRSNPVTTWTVLPRPLSETAATSVVRAAYSRTPSSAASATP